MLGYTYLVTLDNVFFFTDIFIQLADVTSQEERTARVSILDAIMMLAKPLGNLIGAKLFLLSGYYPVFALSGFFAFSGALYVMFALKETLPAAENMEKETETFLEV